MDDRLSVVPVVPGFASAVKDLARVVGFYAGGSIGSGDYRPGISDLDLVAILSAPLTRYRRARLRDLHRATGPAKLHCAYVPADQLADVSSSHVNWAHQRMFKRPLSGIARAELHQFGVPVYGPPTAELVPPVSRPELADAVRGELRGYWAGAVRHARVWRTDLHVDLGLTTVARADETIATGRLITKREAIERLPALGVPSSLADQIRRRRAGEPVSLSEAEIGDRAALVRGLMRQHLERILG
ncbi:nucleotidyltransferase domain-containing protein [Paractinoplanes ferrugineus]|uniref:Nucleotidyltransferase n=1 Tax=Paractinoplanes ferrugineus TaxID=113564 RepID=A0A919IYD0_9ACTN|nr:nucleotidyltransferase domain-containing protein [Actinoplanes ferrugineus]GIE11095.1 nucleotidyltransferase [Actinoplanes ferrugineus]